MTDHRPRLPATTRWTIVIVTLLAVAALSGRDPAVGVAALSGAALAGAVVRTTAEDRMVLAAALFPAGVLGAVAALWFAIELTDTSTALVVIALPLGMASSVVAFGGASATHLKQAGVFSLHSAIVAGCGGVLAAGGLDALVGGSSSQLGVAAAPLLSGIALAGGLILLPKAVFTTPRRKGWAGRSRSRIAIALVITSGVLSGILALNGGTTITSRIAGSTLIGTVFGVLTALGIGASILGLVLRWFWNGSERGRDRTVAVLFGTICGALAAVIAVQFAGGLSDGNGVGTAAAAVAGGQFTARPPVGGSWAVIFGVFALWFLLGWLVLTRYAAALEADVVPTAPTSIALALVGAATIVGAGSEPTAGPGVSELTALFVLAVGLFVYRAGTFGHGLTNEVGGENASARTQFVRLGWLGLVTAVGLVVASVGYWLATVFAPPFSGPATASALLATIALIAGVSVLRR